MLGRRVLFRTTTPCWPPVGTGTSGVGEKTQERTYKEVPRLHPGEPPHSTHIHTHVGADACYGSWWNIWIKIVPTSSLPGRERLYFVTSYQLLMDNKICAWGIEFWVNGDIDDGGVFKNTWELSLGMSVLGVVCYDVSSRVGTQSESLARHFERTHNAKFAVRFCCLRKSLHYHQANVLFSHIQHEWRVKTSTAHIPYFENLVK